MKWSKTPETTIKKGSESFVLVPEQNYRNYRAFEEMNPVFEQALKKDGGLNLCSEPTVWESPVLWALIGGAVGAYVTARVLK